MSGIGGMCNWDQLPSEEGHRSICRHPRAQEPVRNRRTETQEEEETGTASMARVAGREPSSCREGWQGGEELPGQGTQFLWRNKRDPEMARTLEGWTGSGFFLCVLFYHSILTFECPHRLPGPSEIVSGEGQAHSRNQMSLRRHLPCLTRQHYKRRDMKDHRRILTGHLIMELLHTHRLPNSCTHYIRRQGWGLQLGTRDWKLEIQQWKCRLTEMKTQGLCLTTDD